MLEENQVPISARLAEELNVTPPAVTAALKRMTRDGHVKIERGGRIHLTEKGRKNAQHLMLRHQLAEMLLTEVIGLSWSKAHAEAERMEHAISPEVEVLKREYDETMTVRAGGHTMHLGKPATTRIWVKRLAA